jgi:electron transport complex protein RnfG
MSDENTNTANVEWVDTGYREPGVVRVSTRTAAILLIFTLFFTALMAGTYKATAPLLEASAQAEKLRLINEVLPADWYDNSPLSDSIQLPAALALGMDTKSTLYRARKDGQSIAVVFEAAALDGYSGRIGLILAVTVDGKLIAMRVTSHRETPGLGDYIDPKKDRNKSHLWIKQFNGLGLDSVPAARWRVKKDGGQFDQRAGATISARAVTNASKRALEWANQHRDQLFSLANGQALKETP